MGTFELFGVDAGTYTIEAGFAPPASSGLSFLSASERNTVVDNQTTSNVELHLQQAEPSLRKVSFDGTLRLRDSEVGFDEIETFNVFKECLVDDFNPTVSLEDDECVGDEVRGDYLFICTWQPGGVVNIFIELDLREDTDCDAGFLSLEDTVRAEFELQPGESQPKSLVAKNDLLGVGGILISDTARLNVTVTNGNQF